MNSLLHLPFGQVNSLGEIVLEIQITEVVFTWKLNFVGLADFLTEKLLLQLARTVNTKIGFLSLHPGRGSRRPKK